MDIDRGADRSVIVNPIGAGVFDPDATVRDRTTEVTGRFTVITGGVKTGDTVQAVALITQAIGGASESVPLLHPDPGK